MSSEELGFRKVIYEGAVIAGIMFFWGFFAAVGIGISNIGGSGSYLVPFGESLSWLFVAVGIGNTLLYVIARGISLSKL